MTVRNDTIGMRYDRKITCAEELTDSQLRGKLGPHLTQCGLNCQSVPILYNGTPLSPSKLSLPLTMRDVDPHRMHGS